MRVMGNAQGHPMEEIPSFHDADVISIERLPNATLRILLATEQGRMVAVVFGGVSMLRIVDFGLQNVVERIWISSGSGSDDADFLLDRLRWVTSAGDSPSHLSGERGARLVAEIRSGETRLVYVVPSVGAEIVLLCREMALSDWGDSQQDLPEAVAGGRREIATGDRRAAEEGNHRGVAADARAGAEVSRSTGGLVRALRSREVAPRPGRWIVEHSTHHLALPR